MSKAKERALKAYPKMSRISEPHGEIPADNETHYLGDANTEKREGFINGYQQADKDLELTIEDIKKIHTFLYAVKNNKQGAFTFTRLSDEQYQEVLERFNGKRKK